jgi:hypothetical protein
MKKIFLVLFITMSFTRCIREDIIDNKQEGSNIKTESITIYVGDSEMLDMSFTPENILSENKFIADIEKDVIVRGDHVGMTNIVVDGKHIIPVEVKGNITTYDDPITKWGCDASYIKENQKQGKLSNKSDSESIIYQDCGKAELILYVMKNDKLSSAGVIIDSKYSSEIGEFLAERYLMIPYDLGDYTIGGFDAYKLEDANTVTAIKVYSTKYLMVAYMPQDKNSTKSTSFMDNNKSIETLGYVAKALLSKENE